MHTTGAIWPRTRPPPALLDLAMSTVDNDVEYADARLVEGEELRVYHQLDHDPGRAARAHHRHRRARTARRCLGVRVGTAGTTHDTPRVGRPSARWPSPAPAPVPDPRYACHRGNRAAAGTRRRSPSTRSPSTPRERDDLLGAALDAVTPSGRGRRRAGRGQRQAAAPALRRHRRITAAPAPARDRRAAGRDRGRRRAGAAAQLPELLPRQHRRRGLGVRHRPRPRRPTRLGSVKRRSRC